MANSVKIHKLKGPSSSVLNVAQSCNSHLTAHCWALQWAYQRERERAEDWEGNVTVFVCVWALHPWPATQLQTGGWPAVKCPHWSSVLSLCDVAMFLLFASVTYTTSFHLVCPRSLSLSFFNFLTGIRIFYPPLWCVALSSTTSVVCYSSLHLSLPALLSQVLHSAH